MPSEDPLERLADDVSAGRTVDWDEVRAATHPHDRGAVENLRALSRLATVSMTPPRPRRVWLSMRWWLAASLLSIALATAWVVTRPRPVDYEASARLLRGADIGGGSSAAESPGERFRLAFESSVDVFVYILRESRHGYTYLMFPYAASDLENPLPAARSHVLPGSSGNEALHWTVYAPQDTDRFLIVTSPDRLTAFEASLPAETRGDRVGPATPLLAPESIEALASAAGAHTTGGKPPSAFGRVAVAPGGTFAAQGTEVREIPLAGTADR